MDVNLLTKNEKVYLANLLITKAITPNELSAMTDLKANTLRKWTRTINSGGSMQDGSKGGRNPILIDEDITELQNMHHSFVNYFPTMKESDNLIYAVAKKSNKQRNIPFKSHRIISKRTFARIDKKVGLRVYNSEFQTEARAKATADIRSTTSFAVAQLVMKDLVNPCLNINIDATQYTVGNDAFGSTKVKTMPRDRDGNKIKFKSIQAIRRVSSGSGNDGNAIFFIKYYLLISADGTAGTPVYVIATDKMEKDKYDAYKVYGLGYCVGQSSKGYVVFCNSRTCNESFYTWYMNVILIPYVKSQRRHYKLNDDSSAFFQLDGEMTQIQCFQNTAMIKLMEDNHVTVGKPPASTTSTTQPCDVGNCFKASKKYLKGLSDNDTRCNYHLRDALNDVLREHIQKHPMMTIAHRKMAVSGILRINLALVNTVKFNVIIDSFYKAGVWDYTMKTPGPNINTILDNTKVYNGETLTEDDRVAITAALPELIRIMRKNGQLTEKDFADNGIRCNIEAKKDKELLAISNRRYVFLTNQSLIASETAKKAAKAKPRDRVITFVTPATAESTTVTTTQSITMVVEPVTAPMQYECMNYLCCEVWKDGDGGEDWLSCECCTPAKWTCGECGNVMKKHEKAMKKQ